MEKLNTCKTEYLENVINHGFLLFSLPSKNQSRWAGECQGTRWWWRYSIIYHLHLNTAIYCCSPLETVSILFLLSAVSDSQVILWLRHKILFPYSSWSLAFIITIFCLQDVCGFGFFLCFNIWLAKNVSFSKSKKTPNSNTCMCVWKIALYCHKCALK